jgi:hypothetical protein
MRTTLTIEDDVAVAIERRRRELNHSLKQEVNDLLRAGLLRADEDRPKSDSGPFRVQPLDVGELLIPIDDVEAALDLAEGPWRR